MYFISYRYPLSPVFLTLHILPFLIKWWLSRSLSLFFLSFSTSCLWAILSSGDLSGEMYTVLYWSDCFKFVALVSITLAVEEFENNAFTGLIVFPYGYINTHACRLAFSDQNVQSHGRASESILEALRWLRNSLPSTTTTTTTTTSAFPVPHRERRLFWPENRRAAGQQSSREHDQSKQLGSQRIEQMVDYIKSWQSVHIIRTNTSRSSELHIRKVPGSCWLRPKYP